MAYIFAAEPEMSLFIFIFITLGTMCPVFIFVIFIFPVMLDILSGIGSAAETAYAAGIAIFPVIFPQQFLFAAQASYPMFGVIVLVVAPVMMDIITGT